MTWTRRRFLQTAAAPAVARRSRPNVLWLMTDEQRPDSLGCYGSPWAATPCLDQLAQSGALFEEAYTPSPVSVPARSCLLSGRYGSSIGVLHNQRQLAPGARLLTWVFAGAGYRTASFGKKHYFAQGRQAFEVEGGRATDGIVDATAYGKGHDPAQHGAIQYPGPQRWILGGRFPGPAQLTAEAQNVGLAEEWLSSLDRRDPFFLRLSLNAPHTPVVVPKPFAGTMDPDSIRLPLEPPERWKEKPPYLRDALGGYQGAHRLTRDQILRARRYYYERVRFLDSEVARLLDWMRKRGLLDNTMVAFVSDHGAHLGDQGLFQKQTFYQQVATVPYFFTYPWEIRGGSRWPAPVSTLTLLPTLIELAGLETPDWSEAPSLARNLRSGVAPGAAPVFSEIQLGYRGYRDDHRLVMVRKGRYKLFLFQDPADASRFRGREEGSLFDLEEDPGEQRNLFPSRRGSEIAASLQAEIEKWDRSRRPRLS
jgi:arylsulfatase